MDLPKLYIGIDPGHSGGIVALDSDGVPIITHNLDAGIVRHRDLLFELAEEYDCIALLETITTGFPGTGKSSLAKLYGQYRVCQCLLTCAEIPFSEIMPRKWQSFFKIKKPKGANSTVWKNLLKSHAERYFPEYVITQKTSDAFLIAFHLYLHQTEG